jgi:hypothetical protein
MESTTTLLAWAGDHWFITIVALCQIGRFSNLFHFVTIQHSTKIKHAKPSEK